MCDFTLLSSILTTPLRFCCIIRHTLYYIINQYGGQFMGIKYDFTFVEFAIEFLKTGNTATLQKISELKATEHIYNHATNFNYDVPKGSTLELVTHLLTPIDEHKKKLPQVIRNIEYAKKHLANIGISEMVALQFLPEDFTFTGTMFFTFGYDIGVAFGENCSLNLAHSIFSGHNSIDELKYWAIHELHHSGFITLKEGDMVSFDISIRKDVVRIIEYVTHLEGMGTYAPLNIRKQENAIDTFHDYIVLQDQMLLDSLIDEYFEVYYYFKNNPDELLVEEDWHKINVLSDIKRLWYVVGARMAETIDLRLGRDYLTSLISKPSENFIATYTEALSTG